MQFITSQKTFEFPDKITVNQLLTLDLKMIKKMTDQKIDLENLEDAQPLLLWLVRFLQSLRIDIGDEPFEVLFEILQHEQFKPWLKGLFGNLQKGKSH